MKYLLALLFTLILCGGAQADMITQTVEYQQDGMIFKGYLAYDDALKGPRPGVLVVHEWYGLNGFAKKQAERLAQMGYVALAADMYGQGKFTRDPQEAGRLASKVRGTPLMRTRVLAAFDQLRQHKLADPRRLAAIGFCFGGTAVLELAYAGAPAAGVVSFHGGLIPLQTQDAPNLKARFLVLHGADDPHVKPAEIAAFQEGLRRANADWQMIYYGNAVHSFTNPAAGMDKSTGVAYNALAAERSWKHMQLFFQEIFSK